MITPQRLRRGAPAIPAFALRRSWLNPTKGYGFIQPQGAASLGAALANRQHGRFTVSFGGDGDCMFAPGTLIPVLYISPSRRCTIPWAQAREQSRSRAGGDPLCRPWWRHCVQLR
jgi:hypothetical protein